MDVCGYQPGECNLRKIYEKSVDRVLKELKKVKRMYLAVFLIWFDLDAIIS
jgi:hypothetical protein